MVTSALVPLKLKAVPYLPDAVQVAPLIVPLLPLPDTSVTTVPLPSLNPYAATKPGLGVGVGVGVEVDVGGGGGVGVGVAIGVAVGVGVGVGVAQVSFPMVINVPGELWLLYSVAVQLALRSIVDSRTSSSVPAALSELAARDMK